MHGCHEAVVDDVDSSMHDAYDDERVMMMVTVRMHPTSHEAVDDDGGDGDYGDAGAECCRPLCWTCAPHAVC